ncbi:MAG: beta strand repeat-containing protein, partial [bacterium]
FEGITQGGFIPGEPTVGAGPLNIFTAGNVAVTVTNRDGTNRVQTAGATFFGVPTAEGAISDAQCYYDALRGRFIALCFTQGTTPSNYSNFYLAISQTNDARGAWYTYKFDMTKDGAVQTANWADYQGLGVSDDKIVFSAQQFSFAANSYQYQKMRIIDRAAAYSGAALSYVDISNFPQPAGGDISDNFVTKPARNLTAGDNNIYCLCVRTGSGSRVTWRTITGPPSAPVLSAGNLISVSAYSAPPDAAQLGSASLVPTNDCRPTDFYVRNGVLVMAFHTAANIGGSNVSAIRLLRIRTSDRALLTDETFGQANTFYYYPAVTVDSVGTIFLGFGRSSSTEYPSSYISGKRRSDTTIQASALAKAGVTFTTASRWGDYTGIDQDFSTFGPGSTSAWYIGQWNKTTGTFGTWASRMTFTYGQVFGTVADDCDGTAATTTDRSAIAGVTVTLKQGATTVASTTTNALGQYSFGYLESGTYDVVVTAPAGGTTVDATAGTGATTNTRVSAIWRVEALTNAQASASNDFVVASAKPLATTTTISPSVRSVGDPAFTLTVNGTGFTPCSIVRLDGFDRATTFVSATQVTAALTTVDQGAGGSKAVTVFTPTPGGGTSNAQTLTINGTPDTTPPVVSITAPVGGESWPAGQVRNITWTATDDVAVTTVDLALSTNGGATYPTAIATAIANSGSFAWTVPLTITSTARVRVTARDGSLNTASAARAADFAITGFTIAASAGANGAISPTGTVAVAAGATPTFTITPNTGYSVQDVLVNGVSVGAVTSYTFAPVGANQTIAASFAINQYTLTLNTVGSGTLTASPSQATYPHGTVVQLTATAAATWNFDFWSGDASGSTNPLSVTMDANKSITANFGQRNYVWNQTGTASWQVATNWTPNRTTPATNDVLVFNNGATAAIVSNVPTQTVGQVVVSNNTNVTLQAAAPVTVTIAGAAGTDLSVAAGSTLQLTGASTIALAIGTGANGQVSGTVNVAGAAHRLTATDASSLVFASGARMTNGASFSGNAFGTTSLNSVVFQAGSIYEHVAGSNPFGAGAPSTVVVVQAGSRYRVDGAITASLSGRTYADFEYNNAGASSLTGASAFTVDSLIVTRGTLNVNLTGGGTVRGSVHVKAAGTLNWTPASGTPTFSFAGTAAQNLDIQGAWTVASNARVDVNNPAGLNLLTNVTLSGPLQFTSGRLVTGARTLTLGTASTVSGAAAGTGWVHGNLLKNLAVGAFTTTLAIGDATRYAPIAVSGSGAGAGFGLNASTVGTDHPNLGLSGLDGTRSANRYWSLTSLNGTGASWSADFQFDAADVDAGVNTAAWAARVWDGSAWSALTTGTTSGTSVQVTGLSAATAGTQYAFGNLPSFTITASAGAGGSISPSGSVSVAPGGNQTFTITPNAGFAIADVLVNGSSVGAVASYTFNSVGANQTIAASFVAVARTLTVNVVGGGSVTKSPDQASYPDGSTVQLTAVAASGHSFAGWSGALTGTTNPANLLMDGDKTVTATFTDVAAPSVTLSAPDGGETISIGTATTITWSASDNVAVTAIDLALSRSGTGGPFETIANGLANTGSYSWTVTGPVSTTARVRVTARDSQGNSAQDVSAGNVSIANTTGVGDGTPVTEVLLAPVVPNPVRGATRFTFALPREASIRVSVHDVQGRERLLLAEGDFAPGRHSLDWSAAGSHVLDPGLFVVRLQVSGRTLTQRFTVVK